MKGQSNSVNFEKIRFNNGMNFAEIVNIKHSINLTWMSVESLSLAAVNSSVWRKTQSGFVTTLSLPVWIFFAAALPPMQSSESELSDELESDVLSFLLRERDFFLAFNFLRDLWSEFDSEWSFFLFLRGNSSAEDMSS